MEDMEDMEDIPLQKYEIKKTDVLGKGSFGIVYKGIHNTGNSKETVAFKSIPNSIVNDNSKLSSLSNEILISINISEKKDDNNNEDLQDDYNENNYNVYLENIVRFLDITDIDNERYLVYEFCNGGDLKRYLRYFRRFDERLVQNIIKQVLKGLHILHKQGIIHHDIKPENILVELCPNQKTPEAAKIVNTIMEITDPKNRYANRENNIMKDEEILEILSNSKIKLTDFGLSKFKDYNHQKEVSGSPLYIDPNLYEDVLEEDIEDERVDIWAIGVISYELFFYELPFQPFPPSIERLKKAFQIGEYFIDFKKCSKISKEFISFLNCCLQKDKSIRPLTDELLEHEFIVREPEYFTYMTIDNYKEAKYPKGDYLKNEGKITMNINDNRNINAFFDWKDNVK